MSFNIINDKKKNFNGTNVAWAINKTDWRIKRKGHNYEMVNITVTLTIEPAVLMFKIGMLLKIVGF